MSFEDVEDFLKSTPVPDPATVQVDAKAVERMLSSATVTLENVRAVAYDPALIYPLMLRAMTIDLDNLDVGPRHARILPLALSQAAKVLEADPDHLATHLGLYRVRATIFTTLLGAGKWIELEEAASRMAAMESVATASRLPDAHDAAEHIAPVWHALALAKQGRYGDAVAALSYAGHAASSFLVSALTMATQPLGLNSKRVGELIQNRMERDDPSLLDWIDVLSDASDEGRPGPDTAHLLKQAVVFPVLVHEVMSGLPDIREAVIRVACDGEVDPLLEDFDQGDNDAADISQAAFSDIDVATPNLTESPSGSRRSLRRRAPPSVWTPKGS